MRLPLRKLMTNFIKNEITKKNSNVTIVSIQHDIDPTLNFSELKANNNIS